jgi:Primase C terminal 2 (PriCT-2)/Bifunctional DNA primase/polymerase, N-terminal
MAVSPSGSLHYYFKWPKRGVICNSASKIAPGVDVRGGGGMVIAPPSVKEGVGHYRFLNWGAPIADAPAWLLQLVVRKKQKPSNGKATTSSIDADAGLIEAALAVIVEACSECRKWPYQVWFEVGCALHLELGDAGFKLFDAWSASSPTYNKQQTLAKWRECGKIGNYTLGTILYYANLASPKWRSVHEARCMSALYGWGRA